MAKVNAGRQGFLTKSALPSVTRLRNIYSNLLLLGSGSNGQTTFTDSSINNFSINRFGNTVISTAAFPTGMTSSILFDGNGDYLTTTPSTAWTLGTQNFTLEAYFFCPSTPTGVQQILGSWDSAGSLSFQIGVFTNNRLVVALTVTGTYNPAFEVVTANNTFAINTWNHVAYVRNGDVFSIYVNGVLIDSRTYAAMNIFSNPSAFKVGGNTNNQWFNGYLSNVRITIGSALYNGNFTPPALPMSNAPVPVFALSTLLNANQTTDNTSNTNIVDSSSYNWTINYQAGMPSQTQATPFTAGTGGSMFFNGRSDYINVSNPNNDAAFAFGTGNFTIEFWINTPVASSNCTVYDGRAGTNNGNQVIPLIGIVGSAFIYFVSNVTRITSGTIASNTWYHVAIVRISGSTRMYVNGVQAGSTYVDSNNYVSGVDRPLIGMGAFGTTIGQWESQANNQATRGFISNLRVVKGVGVYTGAFTPPTGPLTATQSAGTNIAAISGTETSLLLNLDSNMRVMDSSTANPKGLAPNGINFAPIGGQVNFHPYSGSGRYGSYWFDGTYSFIDTPAQTATADYQFNADFTIEAWIYKTSSATTAGVIAAQWNSNTALSAWWFAARSDGKLGFTYRLPSSNVNLLSTTNIPINAWTHVAVVRNSGVIRLYLNGVLAISPATETAVLNNVAAPVRIGAYQDTGTVSNAVQGLGDQFPISAYAGYMTGLRIVKGTAVYTGNFTPPSIQPVDVDGATSAASYPSTTNVNTSFSSTDTKLLCKFDRWTVVDNDTLPRPVYLLGTAQTSTAQAKFGAASLTGGSSLSTTSNVYLAQGLNFGTGDFTISCWLYANAWNAPNSQNPICTIGVQNSNTNSSNTYYVYITNAGAVSIERFGGATTTIGNITPGSYTNTWFYFTLVRRSGTTTCYIDGTSIGSTSALSGLTVGNQSGIVLGKYLYGAVGTGTYTMWNGYIDDFNVAAYALYIANFSVPTTQATDPYPVPPTITNSVYGAYQNY